MEGLNVLFHLLYYLKLYIGFQIIPVVACNLAAYYSVYLIGNRFFEAVGIYQNLNQLICVIFNIFIDLLLNIINAYIIAAYFAADFLYCFIYIFLYSAVLLNFLYRRTKIFKDFLLYFVGKLFFCNITVFRVGSGNINAFSSGIVYLKAEIGIAN